MSIELVLIPGLNNTAAVWDAVPPDIDAESARVGKVVNCHTATNPEMDTVEELARHWLNDLPQRFHLVGFSFGGYVALAMLEFAPERIAGLTMMCTGAGADSPQQVATREAAVARALAGEYESMIGAQAAGAFHPDSLSDAALMQRRMIMVQDYGAQRFAAHARAAARRPDRSALLRAYAGPLQFIAGSHDKLFAPETMRAMSVAAGRGTDVEVIDGAGHLLPMERPAELARALVGRAVQ